MRNEQTYEDSICAEDGQYRMTMTDPFKGIQKGGFYSVTVDGEQVMYGNTFSGGSESHIIDVGYQPPMTARDREWLNAHNTRREEFHREEGTSFKKLVWSPTLAEDASNWVDEILPTCKIVRQEMLGAGENISARTSGGERDEGPEPILSRWVDNKKDKDYPANQSLTQVFWSASRYVGCAEKSLQRENGTWCYVSLCRYARAGNCSMGKYPDWREGVLAARSQCGPICPDNVCY